MFKFLDSRRKKLTVLTLFSVFPIIELIFGTPIVYAQDSAFPLPVFPEITTGQIAILNVASLCATLLGGIVGVGFYLENRQKKETTKLDAKIDNNTKDLKDSIKDMGNSLCRTIETTKNDIIAGTDAKVGKAKELVDSQFEHIHEKFGDQKERIDRLDSMTLYSKKDYRGEEIHDRRPIRKKVIHKEEYQDNTDPLSGDSIDNDG